MTAFALVCPETTAEEVVNVHEMSVTKLFFALTGTAAGMIRHKVSSIASIVFFIISPPWVTVFCFIWLYGIMCI
jgi:hypothetical protein